MKTKPDYWYNQSAVVPVRETDGNFEVLLVTSVRTGKWILPKGIVEPGLTPAESAAKEAWEEAGIKGVVHHRPLGHYSGKKWGGETTIETYRMDVDFIAEEWLESGQRKRKWFPIKEAVKTVTPVEAARLVRSLMEPDLKLTLVRHAKASRDDQQMADFDRPLAARGKRDAPEMGGRLKEKGEKPDLIVTSPAKRALKTAKILAEVLEYPKGEILEKPEIYDASMTVLLALVRDLPVGVHHVMIVGHNPGLTELANVFLKTPIQDLPTSGVVRMEFDCHEWNCIEEGEAELLDLDYPKKGIEAGNAAEASDIPVK